MSLKCEREYTINVIAGAGPWTKTIMSWNILGGNFQICGGVYAASQVAEPVVIGTMQIWEGAGTLPPIPQATNLFNFSYFASMGGGTTAAWSGKTVRIKYFNENGLTPGFPDSESDPELLDAPPNWQNDYPQLEIDAAATAVFNALLPTTGLINKVMFNPWYTDNPWPSATGVECWGGLVLRFDWGAGRSIFVRHSNTNVPTGTYYYFAGTNIISQVTLAVP